MPTPTPATPSSPTRAAEGNEADEAGASPGRAGTLVSSFRYAFAGLFYSFRTQRNLRIHASFAIAGTLLGLAFGLSATEWAVFALTVTVVMSAEMTNTLVESLVDLVTSEYHPLAKIAKDVAAGVVLLTAIGAVVVGLFLFLPKLLAALGLGH